jgi:RNA polymerase sigma-70 factor, ECF subfamily
MRERLVAEIPHLRRFARSLVQDRDEADDLVQTALSRALASKRALLNQDRLRHWLFRILYHAHLNAVTSARRRWPHEDAADHDELVHTPDLGARLDACNVLARFAQLPLDQRAAIALTTIEGLSYHDTAEILDIPVGTVMSRICRGRRAILAGEVASESTPARAKAATAAGNDERSGTAAERPLLRLSQAGER